MPWAIVIVYIVIFAVFLYFISIRPQKKQQKKMDAMLSTLEVGDSILTTSGFYGVIIDITDEVVIVEFGGNKNCEGDGQDCHFVSPAYSGSPRYTFSAGLSCPL